MPTDRDQPAPRMASDPVNPPHYADLGRYSAVDVIEQWGLGYCLGQVLKYIQRAGRRPDQPAVRDLKKADWYLRRAIHEMDDSEPDPAEEHRERVREARGEERGDE